MHQLLVSSLTKWNVHFQDVLIKAHYNDITQLASHMRQCVDCADH